ncbi:MAG: chromosome segregation protein SMC, partial [Clostridiales bacterium]|nr:chromosome segregation protein SMC [Clostridiales bacterium]
VGRLQQQVMDIREQLSQRRSRRDVLTERLERMQSENERISAEAERDRQRAGELRQEAGQLREGLGAQDTLTERRQQVERQEERLDDLDESIGRMEAELEQQKAQILEAMGRMASRKSSQTRLITLRESVEKRCREIGDEIAAVDRDARNSLAVEEEIASRMSGIAARRDTAAAELAQRQEHAKTVAQRLEQLARDVENTRQQLQAARTRMSMLLSMKRDYEGYGQSVRKLMADARGDADIEDRIVGVVAELIEVPRRYLTAVETALGPAMQHIVTNTEQDAKALIAHLRRNQYGRATFLPLSAIRSRGVSQQERAALRHPGCHGVAAELVTAEPRLREIIGNLLGRTLIAEDMDAAIAIARSCGHSLRIVTLEGDVIHSGGSMTGGSIHSKFTSILGRELELEETQTKGKALSERLRQLTGELEAARQAAQSEQQDNQSLAGDIHEADVALAREQERHQRARQNRERLAGERDRLTAELEQLQQNLTDIAGQMEREQRSDDRSEQDETALREQAAARQRQINALREKRDEEMERLTALRVALAADERDRDARTAQAARLEQEAAHLDATAAQRLQAFRDNIRSIEEEKAALSDAGNEAGEEQAALARAQDALKAARERRQALQARTAGLEDDLSRARGRLEELTGQRHELEVAMTKIAADLETLHSRIWENYELTAESAQEFRREDFDIDEAEKEAALIRREIRKLGTVNVAAVEDYANLKTRFDEYTAQRSDLEKGEADLMTVISDLNRRMETRFRREFAKLNEYFGETFAALFGGGKATLVLEDESDILSSGIEIKAQPVGKSLQLLSLFSGGEKALIATALLFAMLKLRPSPFCVLDEIEAALDEANLKHFAEYLKQYAKKMQFIVVTHRKPTMEAADRLYGVTMEEKGVSRMIAMKISDYTGDMNDGKAEPSGAAQDGTYENKGRTDRAHR